MAGVAAVTHVRKVEGIMVKNYYIGTKFQMSPHRVTPSIISVTSIPSNHPSTHSYETFSFAQSNLL